MLTIYRRHRKNCEHRGEGRKYRRCHCPIWVDGFLKDAEVRKSLDLSDWQKAQERIREWETEGEPAKADGPITIKDAWKSLIADLEARKLAHATVAKYHVVERQMQMFADGIGLSFVQEFNVDLVTKFRATWKDGPVSSGKKLERLRAFFPFAHERDWIERNPASSLKAPKVSICPTMPFTHDEMLRILAACEKYLEKAAASGRVNGHRIRALVLLLRYTGMRIGDAVSLNSDRIDGRRVFLYTQKTGVAVYTVLPEYVIRVLAATPKFTEKYFFWSGAGKIESIVRSWQTRLRKLFKLAKVPDGHAHRFRDTFAVELLLAGVPIERVSVLLGHQSVRITERHYNPWVRSRQEQLEADVTSAWVNDPVMLAQTKGTYQVHGKTERPN